MGGVGGIDQEGKYWGDGNACNVNGCNGFICGIMSNIIKVTLEICTIYCLLIIYQ